MAVAAQRLRTYRHEVPVQAWVAGLLGAALVLTGVSLSVSGVRMSTVEALQAALGAHNQYTVVMVNSQIPRTALCWLVGISLGIAGCVTQSVIRNPLASPDVIGVSKGAGVGAATLLLVLPTAAPFVIPVAAFTGGVLAFAVIYVLAYQRGARPVRLALTGIAVGAIGDSIVRFFLVKWPLNVNAALTWLVGSLYGRTLTDVYEVLPWVVIIAPLLLLMARRLDVLGVGDDLAIGVGEPVERTRLAALLLAVSLASASVAVAGAIGFVGLIAPHIARRLVGGRSLRALPVSALVGVLLMLAADTLGRGAHPPLDIPAGLITALIGGPYFLYLLARIVK